MTAPLSDFWNALTYDVPHNTAVVLRGTTGLGLACGVVGTFLLLRKRSLVADALSHAALPGVCVGFLVAVWLNQSAPEGAAPRSLLVLIPAAAVFGLLGVLCVHLLTRVPRIKEDAAIGVVLSVFFALGVVLLGIIQRMPVGSVAGLDQFIFGQAATMRSADANLIAVISLVTIALTVLVHKELKVLCFDAPFAASLGWSTFALDALLLAMITTLTVIGLSAVGALLMVALLIVPPAAARFWTHRLGVMIALAAIIGGLSCHVGTAASAAIDNVPTGPSIVVACGTLFLLSMLLAPRRGLIASVVQRVALGRTIARQHLLRAMYEHEEIVGHQPAVVALADLLIRRAWNESALKRVVKRGLQRHEIEVADGGFSLTPGGRNAAARIVRTHRLWEHFLTTQADIAPSHVDRAADDIEHVLSDELIRDLEHELRASGALPQGEFVPRSPHRLATPGGRK